MIPTLPPKTTDLALRSTTRTAPTAEPEAQSYSSKSTNSSTPFIDLIQRAIAERPETRQPTQKAKPQHSDRSQKGQPTHARDSRCRGEETRSDQTARNIEPGASPQTAGESNREPASPQSQGANPNNEESSDSTKAECSPANPSADTPIDPSMSQPPIPVEVLPVPPQILFQLQNASSTGDEITPYGAVKAENGEPTWTGSPQQSAIQVDSQAQPQPQAPAEGTIRTTDQANSRTESAGPGVSPPPVSPAPASPAPQANRSASDEIAAETPAWVPPQTQATASDSPLSTQQGLDPSQLLNNVRPNPGPSSNPPGSVPQTTGHQTGTTPSTAGNSDPALGITSAQQQQPMKKAQPAFKPAEPTEQNLPSEAPKQAQTATPRSHAAATVASEPRSEPNSLLTPSTAIDSTTGTTTSATSHAQTLAGNEARLLSLERTHELVALHAVRLKESGASTMRVVLEPGNDVHLSLELRRNNDGIEAQVVLHRGDYQFLSRHWPDLQQRLESRGVHLASLENSPQSSANNHESSNQPKRRTAPEDSGSALSEFVFAGSMTESPANRRARRRTYAGWESWA